MVFLRKIEEKLPVIIMCLGGLILLTSLFTAVRTASVPAVNRDPQKIMSGLRAVLGGEVDALGVDASFSFTLFIAYFLPNIIAGGYAYIYFKKEVKESWHILFSSLLLVAFFFTLVFISGFPRFVGGDAGSSLLMGDAMFGFLRLGFGSVLAIILAILGLIANGYYLFTLVKDKF